MPETLEQRIQKLTLTKTEKIIADYIVDHQSTIGLKTVTQLSLEIGVSDTSIIRLLRALGFSGYSEFKQAMNERMVEQYKAMSPGEKFLKTRRLLNKDNIVADVMRRAAENIQATLQNTDPAAVGDIADCLIKSRRKYIAGFRGASCCAEYMQRKLVFFLPDVVCLSMAESSAVERIIDIQKGDCVLLYSFPRHSEINFTIAEVAKKNGAKVVVVTDRITSPLAAEADYLLTASIEGLGFTNSYVVPMCLSEAILLLVSKRANPKRGQRAALLDEYITRNRMY